MAAEAEAMRISDKVSTMRDRPRAGARWTREVIEERLRAWAEQHDGRPPRSNDWHTWAEGVRQDSHPDWNSEEWPSEATVRRYFPGKGWEAILAEVGLTPSPKRHWPRG